MSAGGHGKKSRALDWWCTWLIMGLGVSLALPGQSLVFTGFNRLLDLMPEATWAAVMICVGTIRLAALIINGRAYEGAPLVRVFGALIGAALWAVFAVVFLDVSIRLQAVSPVLWAALCFAGCDIHNSLRATRDVIYARRARVEH